MTPLYGQDAAVAAFVAKRIGVTRGFGQPAAIGVVDRHQLVAGVVYHNWDPDHGVIEMSAATDTSRWLSRPVLEAIFAFPFLTVGAQLVVLRVSEHNTRMHRICRAFGFSEYRIPRLRGRAEDEIIFTLTVESWEASKFRRPSHG